MCQRTIKKIEIDEKKSINNFYGDLIERFPKYIHQAG
jgi:hypothetical protein